MGVFAIFLLIKGQVIVKGCANAWIGGAMNTHSLSLVRSHFILQEESFLKDLILL